VRLLTQNPHLDIIFVFVSPHLPRLALAKLCAGTDLALLLMDTEKSFFSNWAPDASEVEWCGTQDKYIIFTCSITFTYIFGRKYFVIK